MPMCARKEWDCPVDALRKKIAQLEREADWLAWQCETLSGHNPILRQGMSKKQWREAAREAVEDDA